MSTSEAQSGDVLTAVDKVLSDPKLLNEPRALLLLRICQMAQVLRPDVLRRYWDSLRRLSANLPHDHREAFEGLRAAVDPPHPSSLGKFAQEIVDGVNAAVKLAETNHEDAGRKFRECAGRLQKRWWPFGKKPAWVALVHAWADVDRAEGLGWIGRVPQGVQKNILIRLNDVSPLRPEEWDRAHQNAGAYSGIIPVLLEMLDREKPVLCLGEKLADMVGQRLVAEAHLTAPTDDSRKIEAQREKALQQYLRLVRCIHEVSPDQAEALVERLFTETATSKLYNEKWPGRFTAIRQLILYWIEFSTLREKARSFLEQRTPSHLRDFSLAQWFGSLPTSAEEANDAWQSLNQKCADVASSQAWFLVTLLRRGLSETALSLARSSPHCDELIKRIRRASLLINPEMAASFVTPQDLEDDLIGRFLLLGSTSKRVEFLRELTGNGSGSLPKALWKQPEIMSLASVLLHEDSAGKSDAKDPDRHALLSLYTKTEKPERQFQEYLRMNGFGEYSYDEVDPYLLATLVAWDEEHPDEVKSLISKMWGEMRPPTSTLRLDLLRNAIFERCQMVFAAHPILLKELFIKWVKQTMVDKPVTEQVGTTIYTFSLKEFAPFLYCLLGAQKVGKFSARRCDEILTFAIRDFTASEDLMSSAAELFSSDKGLKALEPPAPLKDRSQLKAWQLGVVKVSLQEILSSILGDQRGKVTTPVAS